jgi:hypothetical protein
MPLKYYNVSLFEIAHALAIGTYPAAYQSEFFSPVQILKRR